MSAARSSKDRTAFHASVVPSQRIFATYKSFPYTLAEALAELVDNATQSFVDHRRELRQRSVNVDILYRQYSQGSEIIVRDDAFGMDLAGLRRALTLGQPPSNTDGRCEFGMGLKTSCCWLGDEWTIRTKQFGGRFEYAATFDVPEIALGKAYLNLTRRTQPISEHYTEIVIRRLHREYHTRTISKAKERLGQAYQRDLAAGSLSLSFNSKALTYTEPELLVENGLTVRSRFTFSVGPHKVKGWVGLLAPGKGSSSAGFDIFRRGRLIVPNHKFVGPGLYPEVTTNVIHQRLVGSIDLDTISVVHLKNGIDLRNHQLEFEEKLALAIQEMRGRAIALRYFEQGHRDEEPANRDQREIYAIGQPVESSQGMPVPPRIVTEVGKPSSHSVRATYILDVAVIVFLVPTAPAEPYVEYHFDHGTLNINVNTLHPRFDAVDDIRFESLIDEAVHDAVAHSKGEAKFGDWLVTKDRILRAEASRTEASEIEMNVAG